MARKTKEEPENKAYSRLKQFVESRGLDEDAEKVYPIKKDKVVPKKVKQEKPGKL